MEVITKYELRLRKKEILEKIRRGAVFIHPTDTIYGLGCSALDQQAINRIRELKERPDTPLSVWVPSQDWIAKNSQESPRLSKWLKELPGAYTLITRLKNKSGVASNISTDMTLGVRLPEHWFHKFIAELGTPIVTTSVNKHGGTFMTSLENADPDIKRKVDFIIYEGEKQARPSKLVNLLTEEEITER